MNSNKWNEQEDAILLKLRKKGLSYLEIAEITGKTPDSLRMRFFHIKQEDKTRFEKDGARILCFDIETSPMTFKAFSTGKQYLGDSNIKEDWFVISWAAKWLGEDEIFSDIVTSTEARNRNDKRVLKGIWKLLDDADVVIGHNSYEFDLKKLNTRFIYHRMLLPRDSKSIDTLKLARDKFFFSSNRLDYLGEFLGVGRKVEHEGFKLWLDCEKGNKESLGRMLTYNIGDITLLEDVYNVLKDGYRGYKKPKLGYKGD
jgi:DNA polymerase elongation subunit (family B)